MGATHLVLPHVSFDRCGTRPRVASTLVHEKNREDLRPRDSQMGALNVKDIADQLTQAAIPTEDETPPDENG